MMYFKENAKRYLLYLIYLFKLTFYNFFVTSLFYGGGICQGSQHEIPLTSLSQAQVVQSCFQYLN